MLSLRMLILASPLKRSRKRVFIHTYAVCWAAATAHNFALHRAFINTELIHVHVYIPPRAIIGRRKTRAKQLVESFKQRRARVVSWPEYAPPGAPTAFWPNRLLWEPYERRVCGFGFGWAWGWGWNSHTIIDSGSHFQYEQLIKYAKYYHIYHKAVSYAKKFCLKLVTLALEEGALVVLWVTQFHLRVTPNAPT